MKKLIGLVLLAFALATVTATVGCGGDKPKDSKPASKPADSKPADTKPAEKPPDPPK